MLIFIKKAIELLHQRSKEKPLLAYRKNVVDASNRTNYQNEYDRIRYYLSNQSILPPSTVEQFKNRAKLLKSLGATDEDKLE